MTHKFQSFKNSIPISALLTPMGPRQSRWCPLWLTMEFSDGEQQSATHGWDSQWQSGMILRWGRWKWQVTLTLMGKAVQAQHEKMFEITRDQSVSPLNVLISKETRWETSPCTTQRELFYFAFSPWEWGEQVQRLYKLHAFISLPAFRDVPGNCLQGHLPTDLEYFYG